MAPIGYQHASAIYRLTHLFVRTFGDAAVVGIQNPVRLSDDNEPEPDLTLLRPQSDFYGSGPVGPSDVYLAVEVSDSSLRYDRQVKIPLYARNGIPEAWLIDLNKQTITVYRDPAPAGYTSTRVARRGEQLASAAFPDRVLEVDDILG
jgi:Uma2 family endonuclease